MIGSVASQFSCCFSSREQKHKCKSKKIAHSRPDGYLHNVAWVLEVSKIFELVSQKRQRNLTEFNQRHQKASKGIIWH